MKRRERSYTSSLPPVGRVQANLQRGCYLRVQPPSFKSRYLRFVRDAHDIIHGSHPLLIDLAFFVFAAYGAYDLLRRLLGH